MQDDIDLYTYINGRNLATNERIGNETQILTNQIWRGRVEDLQEKGTRRTREGRFVRET